jgi:UDP-N-acetylmuramate dehydrogenase
MKQILNQLREKVKGVIIKDFKIKDQTYFKIGGSVDLFIEPADEESLRNTLEIINGNIPFYIIGNGTNLLFSDQGYRGAVIKIGNKFNGIRFEDNVIKLGAGTLLSRTARFAADNSLKGMEFASGIPGYVGGAIAMNAGAYGGEMIDIVKNVKCMDYDGNVYWFNNKEMNFSYRNSRVFREKLIVLEAELELETGDREEINTRINELTEKRLAKQPVEKPSAGSTFKRPTDGYAAKLIQDAGLKGMRHRGAMISDKHCGFIVNDNNAKSSDVLSLMRVVRETVFNRFGIMLEPEVRIIGEEF